MIFGTLSFFLSCAVGGDMRKEVYVLRSASFDVGDSRLLGVETSILKSSAIWYKLSIPTYVQYAITSFQSCCNIDHNGPDTTS